MTQLLRIAPTWACAYVLFAVAARAGDAPRTFIEDGGPCPLAITDDWAMTYLWKHATKGMNVYDGYMTVENEGEKTLHDVTAVFEVQDVVAGKPINATAALPVGRLDAGASRKVTVNRDKTAQGDIIVVRLSAAETPGGPKKTWTFAAPGPVPAAPPQYLDFDTGDLWVLGERVEAGKSGKRGTPMTLYLKVVNLARRPLPTATATGAFKYEKTEKKKAVEATHNESFAIAKPDNPLEPGEIATRSFKFTLPGDYRSVSLRVEADYGRAADDAAFDGPAAKDEFADAAEPDLHIGRIDWKQENGAWFARFNMLNTLPAADTPDRVTLTITLVNAAGDPIKTYTRHLENAARALPTGEIKPQRFRLDAAAAKAEGISVSMTY